MWPFPTEIVFFSVLQQCHGLINNSEWHNLAHLYGTQSLSSAEAPLPAQQEYWVVLTDLLEGVEKFAPSDQVSTGVHRFF